MIQRIQSVFLFIAGILALLAIFLSFPVLESTVKITADESETVIILGLSDLSYMTGDAITIIKNTYISIALGIIGAISLIAIFLFKNRAMQMKMVKLNCFSVILLMIGLCYQYYAFLNKNKEFKMVDYKFVPLGIMILVGMLLFNFLGFRYIKKDDKLVRSADRFR